jgi:hypothetical protein
MKNLMQAFIFAVSVTSPAQAFAEEPRRLASGCPARPQLVDVILIDGVNIINGSYRILREPGEDAPQEGDRIVDKIWIANFNYASCHPKHGDIPFAFTRHHLSQRIAELESEEQNPLRGLVPLTRGDRSEYPDDLNQLREAYEEVSEQFCTRDEYEWVEEERKYFPLSTATCSFGG